MFVHNPCRHYWADIIEDRELLRIEHARHDRKAQIPPDLNPELLHQHVNHYWQHGENRDATTSVSSMG